LDKKQQRRRSHPIRYSGKRRLEESNQKGTLVGGEKGGHYAQKSGSTRKQLRKIEKEGSGTAFPIKGLAGVSKKQKINMKKEKPQFGENLRGCRSWRRELGDGEKKEAHN